MKLPNLKQAYNYNVSTLRRNTLAEVSGSLGDLGTLLPIIIALAINGSISLSSTLVFTGLYNIITGVVFGVPLPVQPMKALAAVAISRGYGQGETSAAGIFVAACVLVLSITGGVRLAVKYIPVPVIKGIQVGAGLSLVISAGTTLLRPLGWIRPSWADNLFWALAAAVLLLSLVRGSKVPYALIVFIVGVALGFIRLATLVGYNRRSFPHFTVWEPRFYKPSGDSFKRGILEAGVGQLPLTLLNSIVAVTALSEDLLPDVPPPSESALGVSVGVLNLIGCWFGAMPFCHGSGGLAAQYRFGARSGASIIILGLFKLMLGLIWGDSLLDLLGRFPKSLLGIMVIAAGLTLAMVGESLNSGARDLLDESSEYGVSSRHLDEDERQKRWNVMLITIGGMLAFSNDAVGFIAGLLAWWAYDLPNLLGRRHSHSFNWRRPWANGSAEGERQGLLSH
ncbi:MAG: hypothetical protein M1814_001214 [Vezdaea aestivalis]|nr:MAG: hypothetical protein M1814_001214 [Vezdaea aestivalis]